MKSYLSQGIIKILIWLAKISITPAMKENNPRLVEKLVKYQLKAKDIFVAAFIQKRELPVVSSKEQVECIKIIAYQSPLFGQYLVCFLPYIYKLFIFFLQYMSYML